MRLFSELTADFETRRPVTLVHTQFVRYRAVLKLRQKIVGDEVLISVRIADKSIIPLILIGNEN